jgi:hypothetical protein
MIKRISALAVALLAAVALADGFNGSSGFTSTTQPVGSTSNPTFNSVTLNSSTNALTLKNKGKFCLDGTCTTYVQSDGTIITEQGAVTISGALTATTSVQTPVIKGPSGVTRINLPSAGTTTITTTQPTTGSAVGTVIDTNSTYAAGDKLLSLRNNGSEISYIRGGDGSLFLTGALRSITANSNDLGATGDIWRNLYIGTIRDTSNVTRLDSTTSLSSLKGAVDDSGGAQTALKFGNNTTLANSASNIWCGYSDNGTTSQLCLRKDGSLIPSADVASNLGSTAARFTNGYIANLTDPSGNIRLNLSGASPNSYRGNVATSGTAVAHKFGNSASLSTAGDHIAEFYNDNLSTLKLSIDKDGSLFPNDATATLGGAGARWNQAYILSIIDSGGATRISGIGATSSSTNIRGNIASSGTGIGTRIGNIGSLINAGDKIASFYNDSLATERAYVGYDGSYNGLVNGIGGMQLTAITPPTGLSVSCSTTGGTLAAGTYFYRVSSTSYGAGETLAATEASGTVASGTTGSCTPSWAAVLGATGYKVYGRSTGAELLIPGGGTITNPTTVSFVDTGSGTPSGAPVTNNTTGHIVMAAGQSSAILDSASVTRINLNGAGGTTAIKGNNADSAGAIGVVLDNVTSLANAAAEIVEMRNGGVDKAHVDLNGGYTVDGTGNVAVQTGSKLCLDASCTVNLLGNGSATLTSTAGIVPSTNNNVSLGVSGKVWSEIYSTKFAATPATLLTCNSTQEGTLSTDGTSGAATGNPTSSCICQSNGSSTYAWKNVTTGAIGTTTTCPATQSGLPSEGVAHGEHERMRRLLLRSRLPLRDNSRSAGS